MESRSLTGVSLIKVGLKPGSNPDSDVTGVAKHGDGQLALFAAGDVEAHCDAINTQAQCLVRLMAAGLACRWTGTAFLISILVVILITVLGLRYFRSTEKTFADII